MRYVTAKPFSLTTVSGTPSGGCLLRPRDVPVGSEIEVLRFVEGIGSDAMPEWLARLADGTEGRIGYGVTVARGYLTTIEEKL